MKRKRFLNSELVPVIILDNAGHAACQADLKI